MNTTSHARSTRASGVATIERTLKQLGMPHRDLVEAWKADRLKSLIERLKMMRADAKAGGQDYLILMPNAKKPVNPLSNRISWIGQYGKFLQDNHEKIIEDKKKKVATASKKESKQPLIDRCKLYEVILSSARSGDYISYEDACEAVTHDNKFYRGQLIKQLDNLIEECAERDWPMITSIVVNKVKKPNELTGNLKKNALGGFIGPIKSLGIISNENPRAFLKEQQKATFDWAEGAPDTLDPEEEVGSIKYYGSVLDVLRESNGQLKRQDVISKVKKLPIIGERELQRINRFGRPQRDVHIVLAGIRLAELKLIKIDDDNWRLTDDGQEEYLDYSDAKNIRQRTQSDLGATRGNRNKTVIEGRRKLRTHEQLERRSLRPQKLVENREKHDGILTCECCDKSEEEFPTDIRERIFEVHHKIPLAKVSKNSKVGGETDTEKLAVLCANCHRGIHALPEVRDVEELKKHLQSYGSVGQKKE